MGALHRPAALIISPEAPYPLDGGGPLRTASLLTYLSQRFDIDLIAFRHPGQKVVEMLPEGLVRRAETVALRPHRSDLMAKAARNGVRLLRMTPPLFDRFSGYDREIGSLLAGSRYEVAVLEHFWSASYVPLAKRHARRAILNLHNIESAWHASCASSAALGKSLMHRCFQYAASRQERRWINDFDLALVTSCADAERVREISPSTPVCVYPNAMPWCSAANRDAEFSIAFSGNLEYEPNRVGIRYFLSSIWPALKKRFPALKFQIIGKNDYAIRADVKGLDGVTCTGAVEETFEWLSRSMVAVVPLLSGSGTRLKIIEAWAAQRAVVSTTIGAEGLGATHGTTLRFADTPEAFVNEVASLLTDEAMRQKIAKNGREEFERKFTWSAAWRSLDPHFEMAGMT